MDMGRADFRATSVPCTLDSEIILEKEIEVEGQKLKISSVLMGVPHTVILVDDYDNYDIDRLGKAIVWIFFQERLM